MGSNPKQTVPVHKKDTKDRLKKILSTIFVAILSFALVLLFVASDLLQMSGSGDTTLASIDGKKIHPLHPSIQNMVKQLQDKNKEMKYKEAIQYAAYRYIQDQLLILESKNSGIRADEDTMEMLLRNMVGKNNMTLQQYASQYSSRDRIGIENNLKESFLQDAIRGDIMSAFRATHLEMTLNNELDRRKVALNVALLDTTSMTGIQEGDLKSFFANNKTELTAIYKPILITVNSAAEASTLSDALTPADLAGITAKSELRGIKLSGVRDLGWLFATATPPELSKVLLTLEAGKVSKPITVSGMHLLLYVAEKKPVTAFTTLDKSGMLALRDLYRQRNAGSIQAKVDKTANDTLNKLINLVQTGKQPFAVAANKIGTRSFTTGFLSFSDDKGALPKQVMTDPAFKAAAFSLPKGAVSGIIKSGANWMVIQVRDIQVAPDPFARLKSKKLSDKEKATLGGLYQQAIQTRSSAIARDASRDWINALSQKYSVKIFEKNFR